MYNSKKRLAVLVFMILCVSFVFADDAPVVTLNSPADASSFSPANIIFNFSVTDDGAIKNCSLWGNFSVNWESNQTIGSLSYTYQETADEYSASNALDGDWNTHTALDNFEFSMNYTKPAGADKAIWTISGGILLDHAPTNYSIPSSCFNYDANKLILSAITNKDFLGHSYWYCYDGTWQVIKDFNGGRGFWEEAVWWIDSSISNGTITNFDPIYLTDGYYRWNVVCYDDAMQPDWADANRTLAVSAPAPVIPSGGGGGGGGYIPPVEEIPGLEAIIPLPGEKTLNSDQIAEIRANSRLSYSSNISEEALGEGSLTLSFINTGEKILRELDIVVESPAEEKPTLPYTRRVYGWDDIALTGWATSSIVKEPALLEWGVAEPKHYYALYPGDSIDIDLGIKTPLTKERLVNLKFDILSFGKSIYSESVPVEINPVDLLIIADVHPEDNLADVYMVVTNLKDEDSSNYVELNFNKKRSTRGAEYYGPYRISSKETMLFAYQYEYNDDFADDYDLKYTLYDDKGTVKEVEGKIDLR